MVDWNDYTVKTTKAFETQPELNVEEMLRDGRMIKMPLSTYSLMRLQCTVKCSLNGWLDEGRLHITSLVK